MQFIIITILSFVNMVRIALKKKEIHEVEVENEDKEADPESLTISHEESPGTSSPDIKIGRKFQAAKETVHKRKIRLKKELWIARTRFTKTTFPTKSIDQSEAKDSS